MECVTNHESDAPTTEQDETTHEEKWRTILSGSALRLRARETGKKIQDQLYLFRREMDWFSNIQLIAVLVLFSIFLLAPIATVMLSAFSYQGQISFYWIAEVFGSFIHWPPSHYLCPMKRCPNEPMEQ